MNWINVTKEKKIVEMLSEEGAGFTFTEEKILIVILHYIYHTKFKLKLHELELNPVIKLT